MSGSLIASLRQRVQGASVTETPAGAGATATVVTPPPPVEEKKPVMGVSDRDVPAPTEIPKAFTDAPKNETPINPPESELPPPTIATAEAKTEDKPKRTRGRRAAQPDASATCSDEKAQAAVDAGVKACEPSQVSPKVIGDEPVHEGFTLYVDCIPEGRPVKTIASFIEKAQEKIFTDGPRDQNGNAVGDYRLIDYGKGVPAFIGYVVEQLDGRTDLALDTRTPEGAVLLEALKARAKNVVRGLR